jgi:hypothetical protein
MRRLLQRANLLELTLLEPPRIAVIELHLTRATRIVIFE